MNNLFKNTNTTLVPFIDLKTFQWKYIAFIYNIYIVNKLNDEKRKGK